MRNSYSLYEAKSKLSAIVRMVREGKTVIVTLHGEPVVEMRPIEPRLGGLEARMDDLADRGVLVRAESRRARPAAVARKAGALKRFLDDRD
ncbi:MAG: type II toxin-antitoxin system prevent-host-death family antitoxin [Gemmatimonadales bacterium]